MRIKLRYFASICDLVGCPEEEIAMANGSTVNGLLEKVKSLHGQIQDLDHILVAVNGDYTDTRSRLFDGDIVALFPPVSGG
jgi:molybdopterin synthase sulfur carrier subunit